MSDRFPGFWRSRDWLLADGATGTNLFNMGLTAGEAPELWNVDQPEKIRSLYAEAVEAGSDLFLTNYLRRQRQPPEAARRRGAGCTS